jgi:hypothetical protein
MLQTVPGAEKVLDDGGDELKLSVLLNFGTPFQKHSMA